MARALAAKANAGPLSALADAEATRWVRAALAERRERDARAAHERGERRRQRVASWLRILGMDEPVLPTAGTAEKTIAPAAAPTAEQGPTVHAATLSYLEEGGPHSTEEDLHPARLDPAESALEDALARSSLEKESAERASRDAARAPRYSRRSAWKTRGRMRTERP